MTTVGKVIFNNMFPADFPYLNEVSDENFIATPDRFFIEPGSDIKAIIASQPIIPEVKKKQLGLVIAQVFARYSTEKTSEILDEIKNHGIQIFNRCRYYRSLI